MFAVHWIIRIGLNIMSYNILYYNIIRITNILCSRIFVYIIYYIFARYTLYLLKSLCVYMCTSVAIIIISRLYNS